MNDIQEIIHGIVVGLEVGAEVVESSDKQNYSKEEVVKMLTGMATNLDLFGKRLRK